MLVKSAGRFLRKGILLQKISKLRNFSFIFKNVDSFFYRKKIDIIEIQMDSKITYPFLFQMNLLIFQNPRDLFQFYITIMPVN